jgi:hypothetical protein
MNVFHFTKNRLLDGASALGRSLSPPGGQDESDELRRNQTEVTRFSWTITMFGYESNLTYTLNKG